jgi:hypothetical protein
MKKWTAAFATALSHSKLKANPPSRKPEQPHHREIEQMTIRVNF